jgi:hypothetical protein
MSSINFKMNTYPGKVVGSKMEMQEDGSQSWSTCEIGNLRFNDNELEFSNWIIPYSNINKAILNGEKTMSFKKHYSLLVETDFAMFMFNLGDSEYWEHLPFAFQKTEGETLPVTIITRWGIVLFTLMIIWEIIKALIF